MREGLDVEGAAPRDRSEQQLDGREVWILTPGAEEGLPSPAVGGLEPGVPDPGELDASQGVVRHDDHPARGAMAGSAAGATRGATGAALLTAGDLHVAQEGTILGRVRPRVNEAEGDVQLRGHGDLSFRGLLSLT